jgi:hypothetical protein
MLKAAVSGSFHRHMVGVYAAVSELSAQGVNVLSPSDARVVDNLDDFLFVASDKLRSISLVQNRHFESVRESNFLWLVCPDGYTGVSASAEVGFAIAVGVPVLSTTLPSDVTLCRYVVKVPSIAAAVRAFNRRQAEPQRDYAESFLLDPDTAIENNIKALEELKGVMYGRVFKEAASIEQQVKATRQLLGATFGLAEG